MKILSWVKTTGEAVASGLLFLSGVAAKYAGNVQSLLTQKYPSMPADALAEAENLLSAAIKFGENLHLGEEIEPPSVSGVPGITSEQYVYDVLIPIYDESKGQFLDNYRITVVSKSAMTLDQLMNEIGAEVDVRGDSWRTYSSSEIVPKPRIIESGVMAAWKEIP
jgi:hypothetical protein